VWCAPPTSIPPLALGDFHLQKITQVIDFLIVAVEGSSRDHEILHLLSAQQELAGFELDCHDKSVVRYAVVARRWWSIRLGAAYWVTTEEPLPKRLEVLGDYLIENLAGAPPV
jgi:hypothetical protein